METTERPHFHFSLSCIGVGNVTPLQCSCLENPRDGGAWWAAVYGVTQSRTRLRRLSSNGSSSCLLRKILALINPYVIQILLVFVYISAAAAKSLQSCPTLCDPRDGSPRGSAVPGILQARGVGCHFPLQCMKVKRESEVARSVLSDS